MCGALLWRKVSPHLGSNIVVWTAVEIAAIGAFVYYWKFKLGYVFSLAQHGPFPVSIEWIMHANFAPLFLIIILVMASGAGAFARVLGTPPMVFLGEISYSVYMLHQILIGWYSKHMPFFSAVPGLVRFLVFMAVLMLLCAGTYFWIEKPARNGVALMYSRRPQLKPA
jgi:peptidoglycan/LPS O-acetylase OafA/YrhL